MCQIINLYGGPGTGKSTTAAALFAKMKRLGHKVELVREYAKDLVCQSFSIVSNKVEVVFNKAKSAGILEVNNE